MPRSTVENVIERARRQLASSIRNETNTLGASLNATETVVTLTYALTPGLGPGAVLSVGTELMRVVSVEALPQQCTVIRGWQDSDAQAHSSADEVLINPRFTRFDLYDAMIDEIESWSPNLYQITSYEWTVEDSQETVELPVELADAIGVIHVMRQWTSDSDDTSWPNIDFKLRRGDLGVWSQASTTGLLIRLLPRMHSVHAGKILANIATPFDVHTTAPTEASDLVADYGLSNSMLDLLVLGIKLRVMGDDEHGRTGRFTQDEPRRTEEVPTGAALTVSQTLRANYDRRMGDEMRKLQEKYRLRAW